MVTANSSEQPAWQRNPIFEFFASLKLAVVLLAILIIAAIAGTIYESSFDAKVARAYVYGAPWFNLWLVLLGANLACSAFSRWPWRKHHAAFLITHLGIITLLIGSLIGRIWGVEGTITLFKGEPLTNRLLVDQRQLRVHDVDGIVKGFPAEFLHRPPNPQRPRNLGVLASGGRLQIVDYAPAIEGKLNPKSVADGGAPALHFTISTAMMNQRLDRWLLADDAQHGNFSMGLANIELKRGTAPADASSGTLLHGGSAGQGSESEEVDLEESIFAFSKAPEEQIGRVAKGGSTGAKVRLEPPQNRNSGRVVISLGEKEASFDVAENLARDVAIEGTPFTLKIVNYWPDFRIENGKPGSLSDEPNNPAVLVTIRGKGIPAAETKPNPHGGTRNAGHGWAADDAWTRRADPESPHAVHRERWRHHLRTRFTKEWQIERPDRAEQTTSDWLGRLATQYRQGDAERPAARRFHACEIRANIDLFCRGRFAGWRTRAHSTKWQHVGAMGAGWLASHDTDFA